MKPSSNLLRSTAIRFSIYFAGLFALIAIGVGWSIYLWVSTEFEERQQSYVGDMRDTLLTVNRDGGFESLKGIVTRKSTVSPEGGLIYLLTDSAGHYLAGNIDTIPRFEGWRVLPWDSLPLKFAWTDDDKPSSATASWSQVDGGYLLIGDDNADIVEAQGILFLGLVWGFVAVVVVAGGIGCLVGIRAQRRIDAISEALNAAGRGQPHLRVARAKSGDDIDRIGGHVNSTLDQLQRVIESLRQVSADIAHDLKTPIGKIQRRLEAVLETDAGLSDYRDSVAWTLREIEGIIETFEALLSIAQLEAGLKKQRFRQVDICGVLSSLAADYQLVGQEYGHQLTLRLPGSGGAYIRGDAELLTQLFTNLIENSIRHCPSGSLIHLGLYEEGARLIARVEDNGPGIPPGERSHVFRRLYRLEKSRTTPGHGLGLSMVSAIASLHEGTIELSDNNPGLIVSVSFPASGGGALEIAAE